VGVKVIFGALPSASHMTWIDVSICTRPAPHPCAWSAPMMAADCASTGIASARSFHGALAGKNGRRHDDGGGDVPPVPAPPLAPAVPDGVVPLLPPQPAAANTTAKTTGSRSMARS
jgi:hypothetical protein